MKNKTKFIKFFFIFFLILIVTFISKDVIIDFLNNISNSFNRTVIVEKRYILFLKGLKSTLLISFLSIIFGTLLGFILFLLQKSKIRILSIFSYMIVRFLQGVPVTVLLLTFYFGIFGNINIEPILVAIIVFSIYFSAYVSEIIKGAFLSINRTQIDSAYALGFTKLQTVRYIIIPQVLSYVIPVYKNESVSIIKSTSIAGYISVMELTKVSDIIRNRTYEAFFPLIFTALIYFIICYTFCKILDLVYKKINPRVVKKLWKKIAY